jgi:hypothetical protein
MARLTASDDAAVAEVADRHLRDEEAVTSLLEMRAAR